MSNQKRAKRYFQRAIVSTSVSGEGKADFSGRLVVADLVYNNGFNHVLYHWSATNNY